MNTLTEMDQIMQDIEGAYGQIAVSIYKLCKMDQRQHAINELDTLLSLLRDDFIRLQTQSAGA